MRVAAALPKSGHTFSLGLISDFDPVPGAARSGGYTPAFGR
jgi:hypothetical protein